MIVGPGATLTIEPGTTVRLAAQRDDTHGGVDKDMAVPERKYFPNDLPAIPANMISIRISPGGRLIAHGTEAAPIIFTSDSASPRVNDWQGFDASGEMLLENAHVEYAYWAIQLARDTVPNINHSTFEHIATCAICPGYGERMKELVISGNTFRDCGHEGVDSHGHQNLIVRGNRFIDNVVGVIANDGSDIRIEGNWFEGNRIAININYGGDPTIVGNEIVRSRKFAIKIGDDSLAHITGNNIYENAANLGLGRSDGDILAENNWWGWPSASAIASSIHDGHDEGGLWMVDFDPFASSQLQLDVPK